MPYLTGNSLRILSACDIKLQHLAQETILDIDFTIVQGLLDKKEQTMSVYCGETDYVYPNSPQNKYPSEAFKFIPSPFTGIEDFAKFEACINVFRAKAAKLGIDIMSGGDHWDHPGVIVLK